MLWLIKGLGLGGAEMLFEMAAPYLDRDRFDYQIAYFLPWKDALVHRLQGNGLPVTCFNVRRSFSLTGIYRVARFCRQRRIDVLHIHLPMPGTMGRIAAQIARVPAVVYTEHNLWPRLNPISRTLNQITYRLNDQVIAVSKDVADSIPNRYEGRIRVINNGVDCDSISLRAGDRCVTRQRLGISKDCLVVGKVANLTPKKNHELLIDSFARLHRTYPNSRLMLVGQFAGRDGILRQRARDLGIEDATILIGPSDSVPEFVEAMDVFAMSSDYEGLPVALLEAMSLAKPVVCTNVGGIPQVVRHGRDGLVVERGNTSQFADALIQLARNASLRRQMGERAQMRVRTSFDIQTMVKLTEQIYESVLPGC